MVGFYRPYLKEMYQELGFTYPREIPLKKTVSDIFGGFVSTDMKGKKERKENYLILCDSFLLISLNEGLPF